MKLKGGVSKVDDELKKKNRWWGKVNWEKENHEVLMKKVERYLKSYHKENIQELKDKEIVHTEKTHLF